MFKSSVLWQHRPFIKANFMFFLFFFPNYRAGPANVFFDVLIVKNEQTDQKRKIILRMDEILLIYCLLYFVGKNI